MDALHFLQYAAALIFVLALIGVAAMLARRFGLGRALPAAGRRRRLGVCEVLPLDAKRRLVLLRRDGIEHLVILGPAGETVIEAGIGSGPASDPGSDPGGSRFASTLHEQIAAGTKPQAVS